MEKDYYTPWEWQPIELMPDGCNEVEVRTHDGKINTMCSCDYWWLSNERKQECLSFRYE